MLFKLLLAIASLATSRFQPPVDSEILYQATPHGPQSWAEAEQAANALYGRGDDIWYPESVGNVSNSAIKGNGYRWPNNEIPIVVSKEVSANKKLLKLLDEARGIIQSQTKIRIVPKRPEHIHFVNVIIDDNRCYSAIGCIRSGGQPLSLGQSCWYVGIVVHEIMHAFGMGHEHTRDDRDDYVFINEENVLQGELKNFKKDDPNKMVTFGLDYDYGSMMHYGNYAFSKDKRKLKTMEAYDGRTLLDPFEKKRLSQKDVDLVNKMISN